MTRKQFARAGALLAFALGATGVWAQAVVKRDLNAEKVVASQTGESLAPAKDVKPGDLVVYTATYRNVGNQPAKAIVATVPVSRGMEGQGARVVPPKASIDGVVYAACGSMPSGVSCAVTKQPTAGATSGALQCELPGSAPAGSSENVTFTWTLSN